MAKPETDLPAPDTQAPAAFEIERIMLNTPEGSLVRGWVQVGPFRLDVHLDKNGEAHLGSQLRDPGIRYAISAALRAAALSLLIKHWRERDERERAQLEDERKRDTSP